MSSVGDQAKTSLSNRQFPLLRMEGIVKRYGPTLALDRVNLEVQSGEIHALLGENGAGKSTLMHVLSGLTHCDSGDILLDGTPALIPYPRRARELGIAMVHQHFTLVPAFTVVENLALDTPFPPFRPSYNPVISASQALHKADQLGWKIDPRAHVGDLPVGIQQRVEIIKALATEAKLLIFDEPTAVLSSDEIEDLFRMLRTLKNQGKAVILIAHKLAEIMAAADRVTVLRRGRNIATADVKQTDIKMLANWMVGDIQGGASHQDMPVVTSIGETLLEAVDLSVRGDRGEIAIRSVSLNVRRGEIFGIGGVDGNGQTELGEALTGVRPLQNGTIRWNKKPFLPGFRPTTGYIPQDRQRAGLAVTMSVEENLLFEAVRSPQYKSGPFLRRKSLRKLADSLIVDYDIRVEDKNQPASSLSGGNQQKIVAARALHTDPEWIVAVNPTRGLDISATRFVHSQLRKARQRGAAILLISADLDELASLSDRGGILSGGKLTEASIQGRSAEDIGLLLGGISRSGAHDERI